MFTIYLITNRINGKSYVGKSTKDISVRWAGHLRGIKRGKITRLYSSMRKHGTENFSITAVDQTDSAAKLNALERVWIGLMSSNDPAYGYNMTNGGEGGDTFSGREHTPETKGKMSRTAAGRRLSDATKEKIRTHHKAFLVGENASNFRDDVSTEEVVRLYQEGKTTRQIASVLDAEKTLVVGRLRSAGVPLRLNPRAAREARLVEEGKEEFINPDSKEMASLYVAGHTTEEIAAMFELTHIAVRNRLIKEGVTFRPSGKRKKAA